MGEPVSGDGPGSTDGKADDSVVADWQAVVASVSRVQRRIDGELERAGVAPHWFAVLHQLLHADGHRLPMSRLAREVSMTTGGFTKLADRMAREGLIDRRGSSDDRRVVQAALTRDGLAMARLAAQVHGRALQSNVVDSISRADLATVARIMRELAVPAEDFASAGFAVAERKGVDERRRRDDE